MVEISSTSYALKTRLQQALASQAEPILRRPYNVVADWTSGETGIQAGYIRKNAGSFYVALNSGTCGATAPTSTSGTTSSDGTIIWGYAGPLLSPMADEPEAAPVFANTGISTTPSGLTAWDSWVNRAYLTIRGGYGESYGTSRLKLRTFSQKAGSLYGMGASVGFRFNGVKLGVEVTSGVDGVHIRVNGRPVVMGSLMSNPASNNWGTVTFADNRWKTVELYPGRSGNAIGQLAKAAKDRILPLTPSFPLRGVLIADSYAAGSSYGPFAGGNSLAQLFGHAIGIKDMWQFATGGTGLINTGTSSYYTYIQRAPEIIAAAPDIIVIYGSTNDASYQASDITAAATALITAIRNGLPNVPILWFGPVYLPPAAGVTTIAQLDAAIASGVAVVAAKNVVYYSSFTNALFDVYNYGDYLNTGDNVHPVEYGTMYIAQYMRNIYENVFIPSIQ